MQKKNIILFVFVAFLIVTIFAAFHSSSHVQENSTCKDSKCQCPEKRNNTIAPGSTIWESLSQQFISINSLSPDFQP